MDIKTILIFLSGPVIGAVIGLITNGIAIRMLFRPLYEKRIGKFRIPFTPGLIPKEKARIARACGDVIGNTLLNEEVLKTDLLGEKTQQKISDFIDSKIDEYKDDQTTFRELFIQYFSENQLISLQDKTENVLSDGIYNKIQSMPVGEKVGEIAVAELMKSGLYQTLSFLISEDTLNSLRHKIAELTDDAIADHGRNIIYSLIQNELNDILALSPAALYDKNEQRLDKIKGYFFDAYNLLIDKALAKVLLFINIPQLVEDRINSFDVLELEKIILSIMNKELKAIVWLGGLLGLIMGFLTNLF